MNLLCEITFINGDLEFLRFLLFKGFKHVFLHSTYRADPVVWEFFEGCSWGYASVRVPCLGIIDVSAGCALPLLHPFSSFNFKASSVNFHEFLYISILFGFCDGFLLIFLAFEFTV